MGKEHKIAVSIALIFFIYGLSSWFSQGQFATPTFIKHFIYVPLSIVALVVHWRSTNKPIIIGFVSMSILGFIADGFTMNFLAQKLESNILYDLSMSPVFAILFLIGYFGYFIFLAIYWMKLNRLAGWILLLSILIICCINLFTHLEILNQWLFLITLLIFILTENRLNQTENKTLTVVSALLLLIFLIEIQQQLMLIFLAV